LDNGDADAIADVEGAAFEDAGADAAVRPEGGAGAGGDGAIQLVAGVGEHGDLELEVADAEELTDGRVEREAANNDLAAAGPGWDGDTERLFDAVERLFFDEGQLTTG
jgi:hypothetical protein